MMRPQSLPRLFIGSSTEALDVAYAIQENLDIDAETTVWSQGLFNPSANTLTELIGALVRFDLAAFVFAPDDVVRIRGREHASVRDSVIFELGLFFGALGVPRCFFVVPRDHVDMHLPTDLLGMTPLTYSPRRSDGNVVAALGAACNNIRRAFRRQAAATAARARPEDAGFKLVTLGKYRDAWDGPELRRSRLNVHEVVLDHYSDDFQAQRGDVQRVFAFLESLSGAVLDHAIDEQQARAEFESIVRSFWPVAASMLAPPNHRDEWWDPPPKLAELYGRWTAADKS